MQLEDQYQHAQAVGITPPSLKSSSFYRYIRCPWLIRLKFASLPDSLSLNMKHSSGFFFFQQRIYATHGCLVWGEKWFSLLHSPLHSWSQLQLGSCFLVSFTNDASYSLYIACSRSVVSMPFLWNSHLLGLHCAEIPWWNTVSLQQCASH